MKLNTLKFNVLFFDVIFFCVFILTPVVQAGPLIEAHSELGMGHNNNDDAEDESSWWDRGNFTIETESNAQNNWGAKDPDSQSVGPKKKTILETLPQSEPVVGATTSGTGANWAQSYSTVPAAMGRGKGTAYWSDVLFNEYHFNVETEAKSTRTITGAVPSGILGLGDAKVYDPMSFGWDVAPDPFALRVFLTLEKGTSLSITSSDSPGGLTKEAWEVLIDQGVVAESSFSCNSELDLQNNGEMDQLFWEILIDWAGGDQLVDLKIGSGVNLVGGKTESEIESDLLNFWTDFASFDITTDYTIAFEYIIDRNQAGEMAYSLNGKAHAMTSAPPIPEPATMLLLGSGLIGLAGFRRKFKKR